MVFARDSQLSSLPIDELMFRGISNPAE